MFIDETMNGDISQCLYCKQNASVYQFTDGYELEYKCERCGKVSIYDGTPPCEVYRQELAESKELESYDDWYGNKVARLAK